MRTRCWGGGARVSGCESLARIGGGVVGAIIMNYFINKAAAFAVVLARERFPSFLYSRARWRRNEVAARFT